MSYYNRRRYRPRENSKRILTPTNIPVGSIIYKRPEAQAGFSMAVYRYLGVKNNSHVLVRIIDVNLGKYAVAYFHPQRTRLPQVPDSTVYAMYQHEPLDLFKITLSTPRKNLNPGVKITLASIANYSPIDTFLSYSHHISIYLMEYMRENTTAPLSTRELNEILFLYRDFLTPILYRSYKEDKLKYVLSSQSLSTPSIFL